MASAASFAYGVIFRNASAAAYCPPINLGGKRLSNVNLRCLRWSGAT